MKPGSYYSSSSTPAPHPNYRIYYNSIRLALAHIRECVFANRLIASFFCMNDASVCSVRYRYSRYRYGCTEITEVSGTGIDVVPKLPKCPVPVLMLYRTYRSVLYRYESLYRYRRYRYGYRTELTGVSGTGIDVVPNLPKCPVPVLMSSRNYQSVRYRY